MGRVHYCPLDLAVTNSSDQDIWTLTPLTNRVSLLGWALYSPIAIAEPVNLRLVRRTSTGSGGTAKTEVKRDPATGSNTGFVIGLRTTPGTLGDILAEFEWEQIGPLEKIYSPAMRPIGAVVAGNSLALNMQTALAATTQWKGWVCFEDAP